MDLQFDGNFRNPQKFLASLLHTGIYFLFSPHSTICPVQKNFVRLKIFIVESKESFECQRDFYST